MVALQEVIDVEEQMGNIVDVNRSQRRDQVRKPFYE